ncbi:coat protein [Agapanthus carlavirus B]|uniref:Capsid protein n=1 Tax=Agapanthus carlavirus B TaxID=2838076 RepID=A0A8E7PEB2_9VIRU|nr:coat protein [Agapanthus carlavirus B]QVY47454.1 coat protein [Agapanthus carlavirus B]
MSSDPEGSQQQRRQSSTERQAAELTDEELRGIDDNKLEERFAKLKEALLRDMRNRSIQNVSSEIGRPKLQPMDSVRPDTSNPLTMPTVDLLLTMGWRAVSTAVATTEEIFQIATKLQALGVPMEHVTRVLWDISVYCASAGSSDKMDPSGVIEFRGGSIMRDSVVATIKQYTTLRKLCRAYAPIVWNHMLVNEQPPANWQAKGFTENTKYAAFDFFDYVKNPASIKPLEGLIRSPTQEEEIANATHRQLAIDRNSRNDRYANNCIEVTGGLYGCTKKRTLRENHCD